MDEVERFMMLFISGAMNQISDFTAFSTGALIELVLKKENFKALLKDGGEATLKEFQKSLKKGEAFSSLRFDDSMTDDYLRFLNENKILYMALNDTENGSHCFVFRNRDLEKVNEIKNMVETIHYGKKEIDPKLFMDIYNNKDIAFTDSNLSPEKVELVRYFMKPADAIYSVATDSHGQSMLLFQPENEKKIKDAMYSADWMLRGNFGPKVKQQLQYRIKGRQDIVQRIEDAEKEFYILSKNNPKNYVHVTEDQISYYKNNKEIPSMTMPRDNANFAAHAWDLIEGISSPVIVEPAEFFENIVKRQEIVSSKQTLNEFPSEMIVEEEIAKYNKLRDLASYKMSLDNENQGDWALYVDSVPYAEFNGREEMLDDDLRKQQEYELLRKSIKESQQQQRINEITLRDKSLDVVIEKARERADEQSRADERGRNR